MLKISKWNETFETAKTRKLIHLEWLHFPSGVDSAGYLELMGRGTDGIIAFGVFTAICQWSATCRPPIRGSLARSDGKPLDDRQIAMILRMPVDVVRHAITLLLSPDVGWLIESDAEKPSELPQSATDLPLVSQPSATDLPLVSVQGEKGKVVERNTYTFGNETIIPNAVNTPECHEAARKWFRHMDESGHPERVPLPNSQAEEDFWREAYKMGHDGFIDAVQYSIGKVSWLSIQKRPKERKETNGKPNGHSNGSSPEWLEVLSVCRKYSTQSQSDKEARKAALTPELFRALAEVKSSRIIECHNDFELKSLREQFEFELAKIRKAANGTP